MRLKLIAVGKIKEPSLHNLITDYSERISHDAKLEISEIKDSCIREEGRKILDTIEKMKESVFIISLAVEGKNLDSVMFADRLKEISFSNRDIIFIIGGPAGLAQEVKLRSNLLLSLSEMTFTHEMARLILLEQVYRAISIIKNRNYHKE